MEHHSNTYEQYCWVKNKNVIFEETVWHNGTKTVNCVFFPECRINGGCRNSAFARLYSSVMEGKSRLPDKNADMN